MFSRKKRLLFWLLTILAFGSEIYVMRTFPPDMALDLAVIRIPIIFFFFILLFLGVFSFVTLVSKKMKQGLLFGTFISIYLLFRYFGFTKLLYQILLLLIFISVELFFYQKHQEKQ